METIEKICINCPAGCHLKIVRRDDGTLDISGNTCPRGAAYARQEMSDPRRTLTAVVVAEGEKRLCIPVKSAAPLPMALIPQVLETLYSMRVKLPVKIGDVILADCAHSGIDIIATRSMIYEI